LRNTDIWLGQVFNLGLNSKFELGSSLRWFCTLLLWLHFFERLGAGNLSDQNEFGTQPSSICNSICAWFYCLVMLIFALLISWTVNLMSVDEVDGLSLIMVDLWILATDS